jgi:surface polysaccharide O-acyltransferase-like enzyme
MLPENTRWYGIDDVRVYGTILVVLLHAAMPYITHPLPGLAWPVHNAHASSTITAGFWMIQGFIMPLFFVLSGLASGMMSEKMPALEYLKVRQRRILLPLALGIVFVLPIEIYVWTLSWIAEGRYPFQKIFSLHFSPADQSMFWGLSHLWFLEYLAIYCVGHYFWKQSAFRQSIQATASTFWNRITLTQFGLCVACMIAWCALQLLLTSRITLGFRHDFLPFATNFCYYGAWFGLGVFCHETRMMQVLTCEVGNYLLWASVGLFALMYPAIEQALSFQSGAPTEFTTNSYAEQYACLLLPCYALCMTFGLIARFGTRRIPSTQMMTYLSGASLWIYIIHHPICAMAHIGMHQMDCSAWLKFMLVTMFTLAAAMMLYEVAIRKTWVGQVLRGQWPFGKSAPGTIKLHPQSTGENTQAA